MTGPERVPAARSGLRALAGAVARRRADRAADEPRVTPPPARRPARPAAARTRPSLDDEPEFGAAPPRPASPRPRPARRAPAPATPGGRSFFGRDDTAPAGRPAPARGPVQGSARQAPVEAPRPVATPVPKRMRYAPSAPAAPAEPAPAPRRGAVPAFLRPDRGAGRPGDATGTAPGSRAAARDGARDGAKPAAPGRRTRGGAEATAGPRTAQGRSRRARQDAENPDRPAPRGLLKGRRTTGDAQDPAGRRGLLGRTTAPGAEPAAPTPPPARPEPAVVPVTRPDWTAVDLAMLLPAALVVWFGAVLLRGCAAEASGAAALCLWIMVAFWLALLTARRPALRTLRWGWVVAGLVAAASLPGG